MTDHHTLKMNRELKRVNDKAMICQILDRAQVACLALHDEPYPYVVPMNYGYTWDDRLVLYMHMATEGHRLRLLEKDPRVAVNVSLFLDRIGCRQYKGQDQDYRSVNIFGTARVITAESDPEEFLHGFDVLARKNDRPPVTEISPYMRDHALLLRIDADAVTAKAQYPLHALEDVPMPPNVPRE